ncbi:hypothetical protein U91I_04230 [alpha proteobacterium U9-1i]|nr:hypothetical protein U91I_04230 [alpha proteobacterium U9-1i]
MTPADWRALLDAYLDGRLSAEAFMRRFLEAWRVGAARPRAIIALHVAVEAFEADVLNAGEDGAVNDDDLRQTAMRARAGLIEEESSYAPSAQTFDRVRAREEMRRFSISAQRIVGVGCLIALVWVGLCLLQITFVSEWIQHNFGWSAWPSAFVGFFLAFVPIVGNLLAFLDATEVRDWPVWLAALVFFAAPALTLLSGWSRWRRQR